MKKILTALITASAVGCASPGGGPAAEDRQSHIDALTKAIASYGLSCPSMTVVEGRLFPRERHIPGMSRDELLSALRNYHPSIREDTRDPRKYSGIAARHANDLRDTVTSMHGISLTPENTCTYALPAAHAIQGFIADVQQANQENNK